NRKQKVKNCPACRMRNRLTVSALPINTVAQPNQARPENRLRNLTLILGGLLLPGFYLFITDKFFIALCLLLPTLLYIYNLLICQTGIMNPFPPSTSWLTIILPLIIWSINLAIMALIYYQRQRQNTSRSNL
ncbi:MAG: hypothetical protein U9Q58_06955, partial [Pseudomonadota bacterium]|nr:hypothetical protein [Pseudomonadota bacterium]